MPHKRAKRSVREKQRAQSGDDLVPAARKAIESEEIPKSAARVLNAAKIQAEWSAARKRKGGAGDDDGDGFSERARKRARRGGEGAGGSGKGMGELKIMPGESMAHFNRRVEDAMRHSVREAMQTSSARMRRVRKEEEELAAKGGKTKGAGSAQNKPPRNKGAGAGKSEDLSDSDSAKETAGGPRAKTKATANASKAQTQAKEDKPREFEKVSTSAPKRLNDVVQAPPVLKKLPRKAKKLAAAQAEGAKAGAGTGTRSLSEGVLSMAQKAMMEEERERAIRLYREMKKGKMTS